MRLRPRISRAGDLRLAGARLVLGLIGLGIAYYAAMTVLLALKADPATIESLSGYRSAFDQLAGLQDADATDQTRLITGLAGLAGFALFAWLTVALIPRPHVIAQPLTLNADPRGTVSIHPRVLERAARLAAVRHPAVRDADASYADGHVDVRITVSRAEALARALQDTDRAVRAEIARHELPAPTVRVTVTRYRPATTRELR